MTTQGHCVPGVPCSRRGGGKAPGVYGVCVCVWSVGVWVWGDGAREAAAREGGEGD